MQEFQYHTSADYDKHYHDKTGNTWEYMSKQEFTNRYPKHAGGYIVKGVMGTGMKKAIGKLVHMDKEVPVYALSFNHLFYEITGYIKVEEHVYIAIVKHKTKKNLCLIFAFLCLFAGGFYFLNQKSGALIDPSAGKYEAPITLPEGSDPSRISIPGYSDINMEAGSDTAYVALWNPEGNPCYFVFTIIDDSTDNVLYESKMVPPGYAIQEVHLNQTIEQGVYPVRISISTYDLLDHETQLNGGEVTANLIGVVAK